MHYSLVILLQNIKSTETYRHTLTPARTKMRTSETYAYGMFAERHVFIYIYYIYTETETFQSRRKRDRGIHCAAKEKT